MRYRLLSLTSMIVGSLSSLAMAAETISTLKEVVVTASPLGRSSSELTQPVTVLEGEELRRKTKSTLGDTLGQELGIRSSYYGPGAGRPVIRGLDGDQIQVLQNGLSNLDASATSVDHNVSIDSISIDRIEVVRGPAALLYGPRAVGGVVNVIDNRIPDARIPEHLTGTFDTSYNSADKRKSGALQLEGGVDDFAWHANGYRRLSDDLGIPEFARSDALRNSEPLPDGETEAKNRLPNSQNDSYGGTIGGSKFFDGGYVGLAATHFNTDYGTVAEPDVTIGMKQDRLDLAGAFDAPTPMIQKISYKAGFSNYKHTEFEGTEEGTIFKNRGYDSRVELSHRPLGLLEGTFGIQSSLSDFSAQGEEAFLPPTQTLTNSGFILEEIPLGNVKLQLGGRLDNQQVEADANPSFGSGQSRDDLTGSGSAGFVYNPVQGYAIALSGTYTERAPNAQELYANGQHLATNSFDLGDPNLDIQQSQGIDLSLRKEAGSVTGELNFFYNRFQDFIIALPTGATDGTFNLPVFGYQNVPAEFYGVEAKTDFTAYQEGLQTLGFQLRGDYVEARNRDTHEPLPRIAPLRLGGSTNYRYNNISARLDADYHFDQNRTADAELPTNGYWMLNAGIDYALEGTQLASSLYLQGTNLLDQEQRNHSSFLKDIAPLSGRSVMVGLRTMF